MFQRDVFVEGSTPAKLLEPCRIEYAEKVLTRKSVVRRAFALTYLPWFRSKESLSHTFLRLVDNSGKVIQQIHGVSFDRKTRTLAPPKKNLVRHPFEAGLGPSNITPYYKFVAKPLSSDQLVAVVGTNEPMLEYFSFRAENVCVTAEDSSDEVFPTWKKALKLAFLVNTSVGAYSPYAYLQPGQSCNALISSAMGAMGVSKKTPSPNIRPGFGRDFHRDLFSKARMSSEFDRRSLQEIQEIIMAELKPSVEDSHERFSKPAMLRRNDPVYFRDVV